MSPIACPSINHPLLSYRECTSPSSPGSKFQFSDMHADTVKTNVLMNNLKNDKQMYLNMASTCHFDFHTLVVCPSSPGSKFQFGDMHAATVKRMF